MFRNFHNVGLNASLGQTEENYYTHSQFKCFNSDNAAHVFGVFLPHERPHVKKQTRYERTPELEDWRKNNSNYFVWENETLADRSFLNTPLGSSPGFIHMSSLQNGGLAAISPNSDSNNFVFNSPQTETSPSYFQFNGRNWFMGETVVNGNPIQYVHQGRLISLGYFEHISINSLFCWVKAPQNENLYKNFQHVFWSAVGAEVFIAVKRENNKNYLILGDNRNTLPDPSNGNNVGATFLKILIPEKINLQEWNFFHFDLKRNGTIAVGGLRAQIGFLRIYVNGNFLYNIRGDDPFNPEVTDFVGRAFLAPSGAPSGAGEDLPRFPAGGLTGLNLFVGRANKNPKINGEFLLYNNGITSNGTFLGATVLGVGTYTDGIGGYRSRKFYNYFNQSYSGKYIYRN